MISVLRKVKKLIINGIVSINFASWKIGGKDVDIDAKMIFNDGFISINSSSRAIVHQMQANRYGFFVDSAEDLIKEYSLIDGDLFAGRKDNYFLFRGGNLKMKSKDITLDCDKLNISCNSIDINVTNTITINDNIILSFVGDKISINGKEIAVIGGAVNLTSGLINSSGQ
ncbi:hypothetical protein [Clostridium sp.]|jgi:hypothetical protein|uniref:hypothetical protein n=1 Tax=Clostridium sp. TaxID=1506 RepID=UPI003EEC52DB